MAAPVAKSGTLTANTVATVTVSVDSSGSGNTFTVTNRSLTGTIWVRVDGTNPTVAGDNCFPVLGSRTFKAKSGLREVAVKLISDAALAYSVEGLEY